MQAALRTSAARVARSATGSVRHMATNAVQELEKEVAHASKEAGK